MYHTKRVFPFQVARTITSYLQHGNFSILSPRVPYMRDGEGWAVSDHPYNYARRQALIHDIVSKGLSFTPAVDVQPDADPYAILVLDVWFDESIEIAKKAGIKYALIGNNPNNVGPSTFSLYDVDSPFSPYQQFEMNGAIRDLDGPNDHFLNAATHYYELDNNVIGWAGAVGHNSLGDIRGFLSLSQTETGEIRMGTLKGAFQSLERQDGTEKSFDTKWLRTLITL